MLPSLCRVNEATQDPPERGESQVEQDLQATQVQRASQALRVSVVPVVLQAQPGPQAHRGRQEQMVLLVQPAPPAPRGPRGLGEGKERMERMVHLDSLLVELLLVEETCRMAPLSSPNTTGRRGPTRT